jgi:hypothetical protein
MSEAIYNARANARETTKIALTELPLPRNAAGEYTHEDANTFLLGIQRILVTSYNSEMKDGMASLLWSSNGTINLSAISEIKLTDVMTQRARRRPANSHCPPSPRGAKQQTKQTA